MKPDKQDRGPQLFIDDRKGAFPTLDRLNSDLIVRRAKRWNIHIPADWFQKDGTLEWHERTVVKRMTDQAAIAWWSRMVLPVLAVLVLTIAIFGDGFIWDALYFLFG